MRIKQHIQDLFSVELTLLKAEQVLNEATSPPSEDSTDDETVQEDNESSNRQAMSM